MMIESEIENSSQENVTNQSEKFYFFGLALYLLLYLQYETQWDYGGTISFVFKWLAFCCLTVPFLQSFSQYENTTEKVLIVFSLFVTYVVGVNSGYLKGKTLLYVLTITILLVFGAKGIEFRKIIKVYLIVGGTYCIVTVLACLMGIIPNLLDEAMRSEDTIGAVDNYNRMSLGYGWSTNMANHVFFIILAYFYWVNRLLNKKECLLFFILTSLVLYYTGSRLSTFCILLLLLLTVILKTGKGWRLLTGKVAVIVLIWSIPFFAFISYYVTKIYDETNLTWMVTNIIMSGRLRIGQEALEIAGIPLLGQFYEMYGSARSDGNVYNYIDNSFVQSLVIYGLVYTLMLVVGYVYICRSACQRKDYRLMYAVFIAGLSGLIAQHFIEMYMNPFLIALFANHTVERIDGVA